MPSARAPLLVLVVLALPASPAAAQTGRPVDRVLRAQLATAPRAASTLGAGLVAPLDMPGLTADGSAARSGATGAIGPTAYVEAVNHRIAVFDRGGRAVTAPRSLDAFTGARGAQDPQIQWDPQGRRWLYLATATDPGPDAASTADDTHQLAFGFSRSADPTDLGAGWCHFRQSTDAPLNGPGTQEADTDPRLGHDDAHLILATNGYGAEGFRTARIFFTDKPGPAPLTTCPPPPVLRIFGTPSTPLVTDRGVAARTLVPANVQDATPAGEIVSAVVHRATGRGDALQLWHVDYANGFLISDGAPLVKPFASPSDARQPGDAPLLDAGDGGLSGAVAHADPSAARAEGVWTTQTVADSDGRRSVVRWYEILPGEHRVAQAGVARDGDEWLFDGAISPTREGDAAVLLLTASGRSATPSLRVLARTRATRPGYLAGQRTLHRSAAPLGCATPVCPWAPSAAASPDPLAARTVRGTAQLAGGSPWITRNVALVADVAAPVVSVRAPGRGAVVRRGARLVARYSCRDERGGSGIASCRGTARAGRRLDTSRRGRRALVVLAADRAGHRVRVVRTYRVR